jgi:hypothetical protein
MVAAFGEKTVHEFGHEYSNNDGARSPKVRGGFYIVLEEYSWTVDIHQHNFALKIKSPLRD